MKHFMVIYRKKGNRPTSSTIISSQWIEAIAEEDVYDMMCERLHVSKDDFNSQYEIVEIKEMKVGQTRSN